MATFPVRKPSYQTPVPDSCTKVPIMAANVLLSSSQQNVRRHTMATMGNSRGTHQAAPCLPPGWIEMKDPDGKVIFYNTASGQTSWQRPILRTLPHGWQKAQTPDERPIFIHAETGTVSYEWPSSASTKIVPPDDASNRVVSATQRPSLNHTPPNRKVMNRSLTAPAARSQSMVHVNINMDAVKEVPGIEQAYQVHQISTNNNTKVLSRKLATDMSETTVALRDTTITAASLATRQAKLVGKTMISPKRMQKVSKKMVVHTGAMTLQAARACRGLANDMVDAADKKGKYQPKEQRQFIPYNANGSADYQTLDDRHKYKQQAGVSITASNQTSESLTKPGVSNSGSGATTTLVANTSVGYNMSATIPARKPVRKPVPKPASPQSGTGVAHHGPSASPMPTTNIAGYVAYNVTANSTGTIEKPPSQKTAAEIEASQELQQAQQQTSSHPPESQKPSQQTVPSVQPNAEASQNSLQVNMQGQLQASATIGFRPVASLQQSDLTLSLRPQVQTAYPTLASPPPSYDQAVRPSPAKMPAARPAQRPSSHSSRPQTTQRLQYSTSASTQDSNMESISQTMHQLHLSNSQSEHVPHLGHGHTHPVSHTPNQEHSAYQEHQASNEPTLQQNHMTGQHGQVENQDHVVVEQNQIIIEQQQTVYQDSSVMEDFTGYNGHTGTACETFAQDNAVMSTNDGGAVVYEEVYFEGDCSGVAHQEMVYMDGEGGVAYEDATMYEDGNVEYVCYDEEEYADAGDSCIDEYGGEDDACCDVEF